MKKNKIISLTATLLLLSSNSINAQVTIGSGTLPISGALLDLKDGTPDPLNIGINARKGLGMPRVALQSRDGDLGKSLNASVTADGTLDKDAHIGLMVYNTSKQEIVNRLCPGLHIWDGYKWSPIVPYPVIDDSKIVISQTVSSEISRTPIHNAEGYPLGYLGTFADVRGSGATGETNIYGHARLYTYTVVADALVTYEGIRQPYACDASQAVVEQWTEPEQLTYIDDCVWMTSNAYATQKIDGTSITAGGVRLNPALDNNQYGAIAIDIKGLTGADITYGENSTQSATTTTITQLAFAAKFGLLYLWDEAQSACPEGWRLPTDKEWNYLISFVEPSSTEMVNTAGKYLRANNNWFNSRSNPAANQGLRWGQTNEDGTTLIGFDALPSGYVYAGGNLVYDFSKIGHWWSGSVRGSYRYLEYHQPDLKRSTGYSYNYRMSVRCVKD